MLDCPETALKTVERTRTQTGLQVTAGILDKASSIRHMKSVANAPINFATSKIDSFAMMMFSGSGTT
jgi:hypothetical protein